MKKLVLLITLPIASLTFAASSAVVTSGAAKVQPQLSTAEQVAMLQKRVSKLDSLNLQQTINNLQQQVQQLSGQVAIMSHDLQLLNDQERNFFQALNQRIDHISNLSGNSSSDNTPDILANSKTSDLAVKETNTYNQAYNQVVQGQFDDAISALNSYLTSYPNGRYVADAHFWLGDVYLNQQNYKQAIVEFKTVLGKYPKSSKAAVSQLKLGDAFGGAGDSTKALAAYQAVVKNYKNPTAVRLANLNIQKLQREQSGFELLSNS